MSSEKSLPDGDKQQEGTPKVLSDAARRALAEAAERRARAEAEEAAHPRPREINGVKGAEPTRYGDWENKGIISDF